MRALPAFCAALALATPAVADAPDNLPGEIAGVIGSGPTLSLRFKPVPGEPTRVISQGDLYADGWVLTALTPSDATLTKAGESRRVGLNPTGALERTPSDALPSEVAFTFSAADIAYLDGEIANHHWDGLPMTGLTLAQTRQMVLYNRRLSEANQHGIYGDKAILGADYVNYLTTFLAWKVGQRQAALDGGDINFVRDMDGLPPVGPDQVIVPAGMTIAAAANAAGLVSMTGYYTSGPPDADGNRTFVRGKTGLGQITSLQAELKAARAP